jgi:transposase InsO family protein
MRKGLSERRACRVVGISRSSRRYEPRPDRNAELKERLLELARPGVGHRLAWGSLRKEFAPLNLKRVHRLWKELGLSRKRRRYRKVRTGASVPEKAEHPRHVWCLDFCHDWAENGTKLKILLVKDEFTREWLAVEAGTSITSRRLVRVLERLFAEHGAPEFLRSDNGPEFIAKALGVWLSAAKARSRFIDPGRPWQNGHAESLVSRLRAELLDAEVFYNLADAQLKLELFRRFYNQERPNSALGYLTPAEFAAQVRSSGRPPASLRSEPAMTRILERV